MAWRTGVGAIWIAAIGLILLLDERYGGEAAPCLLLLALAVTWQASRELAEMLRQRVAAISATAITSACLFVVATQWLGPMRLLPTVPGSTSASAIALAAAVIALFLFRASRFRQGERVLEPLAAEVLAVAYLGLLLSFAAALRWIPPNGTDTNLLPLLSLVVTVKATDSAAYFFGRALGRRPLAPQLSPRKTLEGAVGGFVGAVVAAFLVLRLAPPLFAAPVPGVAWYWIVAFALAVAISGQAGDLAESLLKRDTGKKDSSAWMPGLGGVLDSLDSVLFAAPVAYLFWMLRL
jgi:phosphatidate cytidylyltransferase